MRLAAAACALAFAVALAGCVAYEDPAAPLTLPPDAEGVAIRLVQDGRFVSLVGPPAQHAPPFFGVPHTNFHLLRGWIDRSTGEAVTQLYVNDSYFGAKKDFDGARDGRQQPLRFVPIGQREIACNPGCSYNEEFGAEIPESELRANPQGFEVIFAARNGAWQTVTVTARQIAAQLAALAVLRRILPPAAAPKNRTALGT